MRPLTLAETDAAIQILIDLLSTKYHVQTTRGRRTQFLPNLSGNLLADLGQTTSFAFLRGAIEWPLGQESLSEVTMLWTLFRARFRATAVNGYQIVNEINPIQPKMYTSSWLVTNDPQQLGGYMFTTHHHVLGRIRNQLRCINLPIPRQPVHLKASHSHALGFAVVATVGHDCMQSIQETIEYLRETIELAPTLLRWASMNDAQREVERRTGVTHPALIDFARNVLWPQYEAVVARRAQSGTRQARPKATP